MSRQATDRSWRGRVVCPLALLGCAVASEAAAEAGRERFELIEASVAQVHAAYARRQLTAEALVRMFRARIDALDRAGPALNAVMGLNPQAEADARAADRQRALPGRQPGPLDGIPVGLKDNIDAAGLPTTGGTLALAGSLPAGDATITRKLRAAGAVILGKLTLTELANFMTDGMPSGYSALGGYGRNPYDPRLQRDADGNVLDGRPLLSPSGSSSGSAIAVAANLVTLAVGTETSGSILSPASANGIVGIKPTVGLVSRHGILPITADQDTAGPMARSVTDAAILLGVLAGHDPADPATDACLDPANCPADYTLFLRADALRGARLAVPPFPEDRAELMEGALATLVAAGATVDRIAALDSVDDVPGILEYGLKRDLNAYLAARPPSLTIRTLGDLVAWNTAHAETALKYGQTHLVAAEALDLDPASADTAAYLAARELGLTASRAIIDGALGAAKDPRGDTDDYDAVVFSGSAGASTWARAGYPTVVVPLGFVQLRGVQVPSGISFAGRAFSEGRLIALAYAFEQLTHHRAPPASAPALPGDAETPP